MKIRNTHQKSSKECFKQLRKVHSKTSALKYTFNKVADLMPCNLFKKKKIWRRCFSYKFSKTECWCHKLEQKLSITIVTRRTVKISWFLIGIWEKLKKNLVARLATFWKMKHIVYWISSKTPLRIHYRYMKEKNLSKSRSLAFYFIQKLCWRFLSKVVSTIFLLVCL